MDEHKNSLVKGFSSKYKLKHLVYCEEFKDVREAIAREKQLKNWQRQWKIDLIRSVNPDLRDLIEVPKTDSGSSPERRQFRVILNLIQDLNLLPSGLLPSKTRTQIAFVLIFTSINEKRIYGQNL